MGIQDHRCSGARVAGSWERWGSAVSPLSSGSSPGKDPLAPGGLAPHKPRRRRGGRGGEPALSGGKMPPAGKRTWTRGKDLGGHGALRGVGPAPQPGSSREQRRARRPKAGTGQGRGSTTLPSRCLYF